MKYCTKKEPNVQLINSKVSGCRLVVCEECGCLLPRLTRQSSLSSIFSSTSSLLCPSAIHQIINIYSSWLDFSVGKLSISLNTGWLLEAGRKWQPHWAECKMQYKSNQRDLNQNLWCCWVSVGKWSTAPSKKMAGEQNRDEDKEFQYIRAVEEVLTETNEDSSKASWIWGDQRWPLLSVSRSDLNLFYLLCCRTHSD